MQRVVEQPGVAAQRGAAAGGAEVGFGGDGILRVGKMVADIGQGFDQRHREVGRAAFGKAGHQLRHAVEHQAAEAVVVLGQVVEARFGRGVRRAVVQVGAVEFGRAASLEVDTNGGQADVEAGGWRFGVGRVDQAQRVPREIASLLDLEADFAAVDDRLGGQRDAGDADAAFDTNVGAADAADRMHADDAQAALVERGDLDEIDAILADRLLVAQQLQAARVVAAELAVHP